MTEGTYRIPENVFTLALRLDKQAAMLATSTTIASCCARSRSRIHASAQGPGTVRSGYAQGMQNEGPAGDPVGRLGAGETILAAFGVPAEAAIALEELLAAGFINVERETEGKRTVLIVDAGNRQAEARAILGKHGGEEFDRST